MKRKMFGISIGLLGAFLLWTAMVCTVDVRPIGPLDSSVGLAGVNQDIHGLTGVNWDLYNLTDWLGLVPIAVCVGFGILGLVQWIRRKNFLRVDFSILALGVVYLLTMAVFLLFEKVVVNHRPVLIDGILEASYPSSTTMLTMIVMPTAAMQLSERIKHQRVKRWLVVAIVAFTAFMVIGRILSGVHWITDIIGGALFSAAVVTMYDSVRGFRIS